MTEETPQGPISHDPPESPESSFGEDPQPGPVCGVCPLFHTCNAVCQPVEHLIPSMERGRVDPEDIPRLHMGIRLTNAILDHDHILTPRQREVIRLYYREARQQQEIADGLGITQQAVNDALKRARLAVGRYVKKLQIDAMGDQDGDDPFALLTAESAGDSSSATPGGQSHNSSQSTSHRF